MPIDTEKTKIVDPTTDVKFGGKRAWVGKRFHFDAAHYLPFHKGKCKNLHGHRWYIDLEFEGIINSSGMVIDFGDLSYFMDTFILNLLDHREINQVLANPTAENLCWYLAEAIQINWPPTYPPTNLTLIKVWETETAYAFIRPNIYLH